MELALIMIVSSIGALLIRQFIMKDKKTTEVDGKVKSCPRLLVKSVIIAFAAIILTGAVVGVMGLVIGVTTPKSKRVFVAPNIPNHFVLRPAFELQNEKFEAGTAFAAKLEGVERPVIITALHLFGPSGGLKEDIPSTELSKKVKNVLLTDAFSQEDCGQVFEVLTIPDAKPNPETHKDIAAFLGDKNLNVSTLKISDTLPKRGDVVWLVASVIEGESKGEKLHEAIVFSADNKILSFEYKDKLLNLQATSGAPIVNAEGEIVGINIGGGEIFKKHFGMANPCSSFKAMLKRAVNVRI